jgi:hypothetical protein
MAVTISGSSPEAPQPEIAVLDVSSFTETKAANEAKKGRRKKMKASAP